MKRFFYISLLLFSVITIATTNASGQDLPMVCAGSESTYWVKGFNGHSNFTWTITSPSNVAIPYTAVNTGADTIKITWGNGYEPGIYEFSVVETSEFGCTGVAYEGQYIILNTNSISIPFVGVPSTITSCLGTEVSLYPGHFENYFWTINGSQDSIYLTTEAGTYEVRLVDDTQSCTYNDMTAVFRPLPSVWLGNDTILFAKQTLELDVADPTLTAYQWYSNGNIITGATDPNFLVDGLSGNKTIMVTVTDQNGCENSDEIRISAANYDDLEVPAAFTPNGDQINDKWYFPKRINNQDVFNYFDNVEVKVFNRTGRLVWESSKSFIAWDGRDLNGKELPMDSYHYIIRFNIGGKTYVKKGSITIIR